MFDQVLIPLDRSPGSERVVRPAIALAGRLGARLVLWGVAFDAGLVDELEEHLASVLRREADGRGELHVTFSHDPAEAITDAARSRPGTLIAMATHARGQIGEAVLGSVSYEVLRRAQGPVLFVGPKFDSDRFTQCPGDFTSIAACVDGSRVSECVLDPAAGLAHDAALDLTVLRALRDDNPLVDEDEAMAYVEEQRRRLGPRAHGQVIVDGHPADALVLWARQTPGSILAVATHGRSGLDRLHMGSVAASVVRRSPSPVLVVPALVGVTATESMSIESMSTEPASAEPTTAEPALA